MVPVSKAIGMVRGMIPRGIAAPVRVNAVQAVGRVLAADVVAREDLPSFPRSTVDGFAVAAADTFGAGEGTPAILVLDGEVPVGGVPAGALRRGSAVRVATGCALPRGADAVAMVEYCDEPGDGTVTVYCSVSPGENVIQRGEDIAAGATVLRDGHRLRPQDIGALAALGFAEVEVYPLPRVAVVSTGDEVVDPLRVPGPGCVRDINGPAVCASLLRDGAVPEFLGIVPDDRRLLEDCLLRALECDALVVSGGSSAGPRDMIASVIDSRGSPGVVVHGLALRPGKPTILAVLDGKLAVGLPGHPASALVSYETVVKPLLRHVGGETVRDEPFERPPLRARCSRRLSSRPGREEFVRCTLRTRGGETWADPVLGKSGLISTMVKASAFIHIPLDCDGVEQGSIVDVRVFE
ncbi:MAG: molybdopterin molybdotransferase MoeA [Firmicutes bacterium]|nr:molybdopterin molybdotransferase MoeA [Bacillota bacterium]